MSRVYYTSDLHFGHKNIITYENRPWITVEDMTEGLIYRWNKRVSNNDIVYMLGDFAFSCSLLNIDGINDIAKRLNGKKYLIRGNHDNWIYHRDFKPKLWESLLDYAEIKDNGRIVCMMHYPLESWNRDRYGAIHLHGHLHSNPTKIKLENRYNVGCDNWNWYPVTLDEIIKGEIYNG